MLTNDNSFPNSQRGIEHFLQALALVINIYVYTHTYSLPRKISNYEHEVYGAHNHLTEK